MIVLFRKVGMVEMKDFDVFEQDLTQMLNDNAAKSKTGKYEPEEVFPDMSDDEIDKFINSHSK